MAAHTFLVTQLTGQAWIRGTDGLLTAVHVGMRIVQDAQIVTASGGTLQLQADGQPPLTLGENQDVLLTADLLHPPLPEEAAIALPPLTDIDHVIAAINAGQDPFEELDPTAALLNGGSEGGSSFVRLARILEATTPLALAYGRVGSQTPELALFSGDSGSSDGEQPRPAASADAGSVQEDASVPLRGNVLANDRLGVGTLAEHQLALAGSGQGQYGQISLLPDGSYSYQLNSALAAVQALAQGQTLTENFTYTLLDKDGVRVTGALTVTIVGANDAPTLAGDVTAVVTEDQSMLATGQLVVADVDASDTHRWSVENGGKGQHGEFTVGPTGQWTYLPGNAAQSLKAGEQLTDGITVTVDDGQGGQATQRITVTIQGSDDAALVTGTAAGAVKEDTTLEVMGQLNVSDADAGQAVFVAQSNVATSYGQFSLDSSGAWTYTLNNSLPAVQALGVGQTLTETREVATADGTQSSVVITIHGTNDLPVISGMATGTVKEDVLPTTSGQLAKTDVDVNDVHTWSVAGNGQGQYGRFSVDATGLWTYVLDSTSAKVQALAEGQKVTDTTTVTVNDGQGGTAVHSVTVEITGSNEAPVPKAVAATTAEDTIVAISLQGTDADGTVVSFQLASQPANGLLYKDAAGTQLLSPQDVIAATGNAATIYFKPNPDWSGTTTFNYHAKDNLGQVSSGSATGTLSVTPVSDIPYVSVNVGASSTPITTAINASTVLTANPGYTVTATNVNGTAASVSKITGTSHDGFGVLGTVAGNAPANTAELARGTAGSEKLTIAFNIPVTKINVQFAWLASGERARYVMYDEAGNILKTAEVQGVLDTVEKQFSLAAPIGTTIGKIVFDAPRVGDDYLIHKVTYTTAVTYPITITATPQDTDGSENVTSIVVEVAKGITLSAGTQIDATHWSLALTSSDGYAVAVNPATHAVTITGLKMTVPDNVTDLSVKVVATVTDGSNSVTGSHAYDSKPVAHDDQATATLTTKSVAGANGVEWAGTALSGTVQANDTWVTAGQTSVLALLVGTSWVNASAAGTAVVGAYGTLVIKSDGSYTYTPVADQAHIGAVEHFSYKLTQADGDTDSAQLNISIAAAGPDTPAVAAFSMMSSVRAEAPSERASGQEVHGTSASDTLMGTEEEDLFTWQRNDAGSDEQPVTDVVKHFGAAGKDSLNLSDLLQGEENTHDLSKFLHLESRVDADGKTLDTLIKVSAAGGLDAQGNGYHQQILLEGVNLVGEGQDQNALIRELIDQGKLKLDHS